MMNDPAAARPHVVVVDDEPDLCELLAMRLDHHGYRVSVEHTARGALEVLEREMVDAMILDLRLEEENGLDVLTEVQKHSPDLPVIMLTAHGSIETAMEAVQRGAYGFLTKPFHHHDLLQKLEHGVERVRLRREVQGLRHILGEHDHATRLLGTSGRITAVREVIARVAPSDATVLVLGESGTGKELCARSLHALSPRASRPFVAIHCGALPPDLLESELFGYRKGAFTGAMRDKDGFFAAADGGTIFLDEIGEAPLPVQVKLLRALQERRFTPVGDTQERAVDVRVVAATNRDLKQLVDEGRFREDLFYRLHVVPILMPPLRERKEDIPLLAELFLGRAAARHGLSAAHLTSETLRALREHDWPGNVRELANVIEGAALLSTDGNLRPHHLLSVIPRAMAPAREAESPAPPAAPAPAPAPAVSDGAAEVARLLAPSSALPPLRDAREVFDRAYLAEALRRSGGNVTAAAKVAGRNRTDFHELLRRHEIVAAEFKD
ncbi:MAG: sigma-54 dependent transcriptional regulator [Polyangiaceae bacterium]